MDAPPPGTFSYTDSKPRSPQEAIELLNKSLVPKGYALLATEDKLLVLKLEQPPTQY
jgi:hypothetical protein